MRKAIIYISILLVSVGAVSFISCTERADRNGNDSPKGYNLDKPIKYNMPDELLEISGITFNNGKSDSLYAEQDEEGKVFYFKLGDKEVSHSRFGKKGDYEDIAICHNRVIMLRSDGVLFTFPLSQIRSKEVADVQKLEGLLPPGEYEGMYADEKSGQLYILCKHCTDEHTTKSSSGYIFALQADGSLKQSGDFGINVKSIEKILGKKRIGFHPSALAKNVNTNEWYILSSVNKILVITDINWNVTAVYPLNTSLFGQPEGMAFDANYNLYISNEGSKTSEGNVLKFKYTK
jgi:hypothetical protein